VFLGFPSRVAEVFFLGYDTASLGNWLPTRCLSTVSLINWCAYGHYNNASYRSPSDNSLWTLLTAYGIWSHVSAKLPLSDLLGNT